MKRTILVVDDDKSNLLIAQKLLSDEYRVAAVNSGEKAFEYLQKNEPSLILLDISMPGMNGLEVMEHIRCNSDWCRIPVIFLTADRSNEMEEKCFELGAVDYISKPFVASIMHKRVDRMIELEEYRKRLERMVAAQLAPSSDWHPQSIPQSGYFSLGSCRANIPSRSQVSSPG